VANCDQYASGQAAADDRAFRTVVIARVAAMHHHRTQHAAPTVTDYLSAVYAEVERQYLADAIRIVRELAPTAASFTVATTDQDYSGFDLVEVELADGRLLSDVDEALSDRVRDDVWPDLMSIGWNGPIARSRSGNGRVFIDGRSEPT
jgi:hypothetical protein